MLKYFLNKTLSFIKKKQKRVIQYTLRNDKSSIQINQIEVETTRKINKTKKYRYNYNYYYSGLVSTERNLRVCVSFNKNLYIITYRTIFYILHVQYSYIFFKQKVKNKKHINRWMTK